LENASKNCQDKADTKGYGECQATTTTTTRPKVLPSVFDNGYSCPDGFGDCMDDPLKAQAACEDNGGIYTPPPPEECEVKGGCHRRRVVHRRRGKEGSPIGAVFAQAALAAFKSI
jgi:hypothetical protein